jgi:hypothetical protein
MRTCSPAEFVRRWPGSLGPIVFPEPPPALPEDSRKWLAEFGLPRELTIECYNDITLKFSGAATPLATIWERDLKRGLKLMMRGYQPGEMPGDWTRFWHLADQEYVQGGGWIGIEEITGRLVVIDLDLHDPIYLLNSSVSHFYTTLAHFLEWSKRTGGSPAETVHLRDALRGQDCIPPEELEPFWLNIIDATLDSESVNLAVALGSKRDEPGDRSGTGRT